MPTLGNSVVGSGISMAVAERAREMSLLDSLPGMSFLAQWELDFFLQQSSIIVYPVGGGY